MALEPTDWSVVVAGRWNPAILTPSGIASRLFELTEETLVEVQVPINMPAPPRVTYDGQMVSVSSSKLIIKPKQPTLSALKHSLTLGRRALGSLPATPVSAAGYNLNFQTGDSLDALVEAHESPIDGGLAELGYTASESALRRDVPFQDGTLSLTLTHSASGHRIDMNFAQQSQDAETLSAWLEVNLEHLEDAVKGLLSRGVGCWAGDINLEEGPNNGD